MIIFDAPEDNDWHCPICGTNDKKQCTLIGIDDTQEDGNIRAQMFHVDCIDLLFFNNGLKSSFLAMKFNTINPKQGDTHE